MSIVRFSNGHTCPVCGGSDHDTRGQGTRCHGFISAEWVHCSREEHAGKARFSEESGTYAHRLKGTCPCGVEHAPADPPPARRGKQRGRVECVYPYHAADGKLLFEVVRFQAPKGFAQRRPGKDAKGKLLWGLGEVEPVLYGLPELLNADPGETVYVVEGERDRDRLVSLGFVATCNPMGAGKWMEHYSDDLRGRAVVIVPDNDRPGREHAQRVAQSLAGKARSVRLVELPDLPEKGDTSDWLDAGGTADRLRELAAATPEWTPPAAAGPITPPVAPATPPKNESQAETLLRLAGAATLFHDPAGRTYAAVPINGHVEVHEIRSTGFRRWLTRQFYREENRPPSSQAIQDAVGILDARATYDGPVEKVFVRVAERGDRIYIDLGDDTWRAVEVDAAGWRIVATPPVRFRRPSGMESLPDPARGGTIDRLRDFVNVEADELPLFIAWLAAALRPTGPYPILVLIGEQGSAKSTHARLARRMIDPHVSPLRCEPKESRDLMVGAVNGWIVALDNLSTIPPWLSDALCRLSTGGGFATRTLYSNDEETFLDATRPVILTGISDFVSRGDLIDRSLFIHLPAIPEEKRRTEGQVWRDFEAEAPKLFGALLDALAGGLRMLPGVRSPKLPRLADFALFGQAVSRALGHPPDSFLTAYDANRRDANESAVEDSPVAGAVRHLASRGSWTGTAAELQRELTAIVSERVAESKHWPRSARGMSSTLRRLAPALRMVGVEVDFGERTKKARPITIRLADRVGDDPVTIGDDHPIRPSPMKWLETRPGVASDDGDGLFPLQSGDPAREVFEV